MGTSAATIETKLLSVGTERVIGKVKWFDFEKGFGFIRPDAGGPEVFLHHTDLPDSLAAGDNRWKMIFGGQRISCLLGRSARGPIAESIQVLYRTE